MSECFLCHSILESANDAEIEGVDLCVDCCERLDVVIKDYLCASPGGYDLLIDIIAEEILNPEGKLRDAMIQLINEKK